MRARRASGATAERAEVDESRAVGVAITGLVCGHAAALHAGYQDVEIAAVVVGDGRGVWHSVAATSAPGVGGRTQGVNRAIRTGCVLIDG